MGVGVGVIMRMIVRVAVIMRVLFKMFVMVLVRMIVIAATATAAAALLLMRLMILRLYVEHFVMVLMRMVVAASAIMIMMVMVVPVSMVMIMGMTMVSVIVMMAMMTALIVSATLRLERPLDRRHGTAETAQHFDKHMIIFDIDRIGRHFCRSVTVADVPCGFHQTRRIFRPDLDKLLRCCLDCDEASIFELQRIAIVQHDSLVEIEQEFGAFLALERHPAAMAAFMIQ